MKIDFEQREIVCSVNDLTYDSAHHKIGGDRGEGFRRMWIGQDLHSRRADQRAGEDPNYRAEVWVSSTFETRGWKVSVQGRIDGLSTDREKQHLLVEEVKSLHFELELAGIYRSEKLQRFLYQLMLYAYLLSRREDLAGFAVFPQLVLIDIASDNVRIVDAPYDPGRIESILEASLEELVDRLEADRALQAAKRSFAEGLPFPFDTMRPYQQEMMDAVERAVRDRESLLVSAPTGVGKTIAAIYPALRETLRAGKKLFYLTSKTLQQEIAVSTLALLNDGSFRVLRVRAKQKMCAHTEMICHEQFCPYARAYPEKMEKSGLRSRIVTDLSYFDPEVIYEMSKSTEVCPFEVSLELIEDADVVVCDYNYIFDPYVGLKAYRDESDYSDCVLIIDEAHNLADRGRGYYSPELHEKQLDAVRDQFRSRACDVEWEPLIEELRAHFGEMSDVLHGRGAEVGEEDAIVETPLWTWGQMPTRRVDRVAESTAAVPRQALTEFNRRFFHRQRAEWEGVMIDYVTWKIANRVAEESDPVIDFYFKLVKFTDLLSEEGDEFAHLIESTPDGLKLKIFCKDPSKFLGEVIDSAHATIAISATLQPFDFYRQILGFPSSRCAEIALPSPFPRDNRKIVIVSDVDTTYKERSAHYHRIAQTIADLSGASDGNFLALFPSYAFLRSVSDAMPYLDRNVMIQRSDMTDYERWSFLETLRRSGGGNLIMGVSGGMYAEGIDYQGEMLSGVFVVGPALPTVSFEQELLKRYYDEQYGTGFEYAYLIPGMTRVIQSAGRVIRSDTDVGVIVLLCKRFAQEKYNRYFPLDWYETSPRELVTKKAAEDVRLFFEGKKRGQLRMFQ